MVVMYWDYRYISYALQCSTVAKCSLFSRTVCVITWQQTNDNLVTNGEHVIHHCLHIKSRSSLRPLQQTSWSANSSSIVLYNLLFNTEVTTSRFHCTNIDHYSNGMFIFQCLLLVYIISSIQNQLDHVIKFENVNLKFYY